jgi:hypothetical protein
MYLITIEQSQQTQAQDFRGTDRTLSQNKPMALMISNASGIGACPGIGTESGNKGWNETLACTGFSSHTGNSY